MSVRTHLRLLKEDKNILLPGINKPVKTARLFLNEYCIGKKYFEDLIGIDHGEEAQQIIDGIWFAESSGEGELSVEELLYINEKIQGFKNILDINTLSYIQKLLELNYISRYDIINFRVY